MAGKMLRRNRRSVVTIWPRAGAGPFLTGWRLPLGWRHLRTGLFQGEISRDEVTMIDRARRSLLFSACAVAALTVASGVARASDQQLVIDRSRIVVEGFLNDTEFAKMRVYVQNAYAVLIVP